MDDHHNLGAADLGRGEDPVVDQAVDRLGGNLQCFGCLDYAHREHIYSPLSCRRVAPRAGGVSFMMAPVSYCRGRNDDGTTDRTS